MRNSENYIPTSSSHPEEKSEPLVKNPYISLLMVSLIWGINFSIVKHGVMIIGPLSFSLIRFTVSSLIMIILLWRIEGNPFIKKKDIWYFIFLGALGFGIYQPLWSYGLRLTLASHSAILLSISPIVVVLIAYFKKEENVEWYNFLGIGIGFLGVTFLISQGKPSSFSPHILLGDILTLLAAICWGLYSYFGKHMLRKYSPLKTSCWSIIFGTFIMFPISYFEIIDLDLSDMTLPVYLSMGYAIFLSAILGYIIWMNGIKKIGASRTSAFQYVTQIFGVIGAWLFFKEPFGYRFLIGMVLVTFGVWLTQRKPRPLFNVTNPLVKE
ncbi:MAG: DMT family transporter [Atribacter sp.]|jgi:drug/metabolite transporter (DMT)-like permease|uniref:DMT family transporter n=1 Tax=Atribacter sp. TaxID=2847780 RepID=UPI003D976C94